MTNIYTILFFTFCTILGIQIFYLVVVFSRFLLEKATVSNTDVNIKSVSVIVCAYNEFDNLFELIPILATQKHPDYEVIIVDDRSNDGTAEYLKNELLLYPNFRIVTITETPEHLSPKKYALSLGIKVATKDLILLTDADCRPTSDEWVNKMATRLTKGKQIVLGFSPYWAESGLLNRFIRFETFFTAWQYFSYALLGMPYMGVGRNLMYKKKLFIDKLGFRNHQRIFGGDDDLFVNENATKNNIAICFDGQSHMISEPKHSFGEWLQQKKRHLRIGKFYNTGHKIVLGMYSFTHLLSWLIIPFIFLLENPQQQIVGVIIGLRILLFWVFGSIANYKLKNPTDWYALPFYDLLLAAYYSTIGWYSVLKTKNNRW